MRVCFFTCLYLEAVTDVVAAISPPPFFASSDEEGKIQSGTVKMIRRLFSSFFRDGMTEDDRFLYFLAFFANSLHSPHTSWLVPQKRRRKG